MVTTSIAWEAIQRVASDSSYHAADKLARDRPDTNMQMLATIEREKRRETDPWSEPIGKIIDNIGAPTHTMSLPGPGITMHEIMNQLDLPSAQRTRREELRIAMILRTMGFVHKKVPRVVAGERKYFTGYVNDSTRGITSNGTSSIR